LFEREGKGKRGGSTHNAPGEKKEERGGGGTPPDLRQGGKDYRSERRYSEERGTYHREK